MPKLVAAETTKKEEKRFAKQQQEHQSLYKDHDSSKDIVMAKTGNTAPTRTRKSKIQKGTQTYFR